MKYMYYNSKFYVFDNFSTFDIRVHEVFGAKKNWKNCCYSEIVKDCMAFKEHIDSV